MSQTRVCRALLHVPLFCEPRVYERYSCQLLQVLILREKPLNSSQPKLLDYVARVRRAPQRPS